MTNAVTALVPYHDGYNKHAHSDPANRPEYLDWTLDSLRGFAGKVNVGRVQGKRCEPHYLPANLCRWAQKHGVDTDYVYFTEADQILHWSPDIFQHVHDRDYLVPHRREEEPDGTMVFGNGNPDDDPAVTLNVPNPDGRTYHPWGDVLSYGGAWLCTRELFHQITFTDNPVTPLEQTAGFDINRDGHSLKTQDWTRFWVEHLSGKEHRAK